MDGVKHEEEGSGKKPKKLVIPKRHLYKTLFAKEGGGTPNAVDT
jgi:hypothetical protein